MKKLNDYNLIKNVDTIENKEIRKHIENNFNVSCDNLQRFLDDYFKGMGLEITTKIFNDNELKIIISQVDENGIITNDFNAWV